MPENYATFSFRWLRIGSVVAESLRFAAKRVHVLVCTYLWFPCMQVIDRKQVHVLCMCRKDSAKLTEVEVSRCDSWHRNRFVVVTVVEICEKELQASVQLVRVPAACFVTVEKRPRHVRSIVGWFLSWAKVPPVLFRFHVVVLGIVIRRSLC